jgi:hypothetical protein
VGGIVVGAFVIWGFVSMLRHISATEDARHKAANWAVSLQGETDRPDGTQVLPETDRWGNPLEAQFFDDGRVVIVRSYGPDGEAGTPDDITSIRKTKEIK